MLGFRDVLLNVPKSELHLHLRGAMPVQVFTDLLNKYSECDVFKDAPDRHITRFNEYDNIRPFLARRRWTADDAVKLFRYETFGQFLATYAFTSYFVREVSDLRALVKGVLQSLKAQNVVYAEIMLTVVDYLRRGFSLADIISVLEEAADSSKIRVQWIADLVRDTGSEAALALLKDIIELRCESIVGITLGGSEHLFPPAQFAEVYSTARENGLRLTVHAGEALGPESVWDALSILGTERVGHGVRAIEDSSLVSYLAENAIPLEVCPTSNLQTGMYPSYDAHPVKELYEAGVPIAISSDDPTFFGTTLTDELVHVHTVGVPKEGVFDMIRNGFIHSFLPGDQIKKYVDDLERAWAAHYPEGTN